MYRFTFSAAIICLLHMCHVHAQYGSFIPISEEPIDSDPDYISVQIVDLNQDGRPDILAKAIFSIKQICWFPNLGDNIFGESIPIDTVNFGVHNFVKEIEAVDMDMDGDQDVYIRRTVASENAGWYRNDGQGNFSELINEFPARGGSGYIEFLYSDIDADGDPDLLYFYDWEAEGELLLRLNQGDGSLSDSIRLDSLNLPTAFSIELADFDGDGRPDILVEDPVGLLWYRNLGNAEFSEQKRIYNILQYDENRTFDLADLDGDGAVDIVFSEYSDFRIRILYNDGDGNFLRIDTIPLVSAPFMVRVTDINRDFYPDLVVSSEFGPERYLWLQNDGIGGFEEPVVIYEEDDFFLITTGFALGDLDQDGFPDLVGAALRDSIFSRSILLSRFRNAGDYPRRIEGVVYHDRNGNGIREAGENGLFGQGVWILPDSSVQFTSQNGHFNYLGQLGVPYTIGWLNDTLWELSTDSVLYHTILPEEVERSYSFGLYPRSNVPDVHVVVSSFTPRCNQSVEFSVHLVNSGSADAKLDVRVDKIDEIEILSISEEPSMEDAEGYYWEDYILPAGSVRSIDMSLRMPDAVFTGDTFQLAGRYSIMDTMGNVLDTQEVSYPFILLCSYDPNDKQVQPLGEGEKFLTLKDTELSYLIRFQNTGNDVALDVVIRDTIDEDLNLETFRVNGSSHPVQTSLEGRVVAFTFFNILLPDSTSDPEGSQGYVSFSISPLSGLEDSSVIRNEAGIYFDLNDPIVTNLVTNTLVTSLEADTSVGIFDEKWGDLEIRIHSNPIQEYSILEFIGLSEAVDMSIHDLNGRKVRSYSDFYAPSITIYRSGLPAGLYVLNIRETNSGRIIRNYKLVIQ